MIFAPACFALLGVSLSTAIAGERALYADAVGLIEDRYLRIEQVSAAEALREAAEAAEAAIPWLIVDPAGPNGVVLRHGMRGELGRVELAGGDRAVLGDLPAALVVLEDTLRGAGDPLPDDIDLPVELLRGVTRALDRHSSVLAGERLQSFDVRVRGSVSGIGAKIGLVDGELTVKEVYAGSPAALGGLVAGDVILRVDDVSTLGMPVSRAVERIRGPAGSTVTVRVRHTDAAGVATEYDLGLPRRDVAIPNVSWSKLPSGVGVLTIDHFSENTERLVAEGLRALRADAPPLVGLVLDLRGDAGGSLIQAARTVDTFVDRGLVLRTAGREGVILPDLVDHYEARPEPDDALDLPMAVLVDDGSASASEIVAGALSRLGRAVLVGQRTYGKGTVQKLFPLREGKDPVRFKLTIAEYRLEGDTPVADVGLAPDAWVDRAVLGKNGASLPEGVPAARRVMSVELRPGWVEGSAAEDPGDTALILAERALLGARGPDRAALLASLDAVSAAMAEEEDARLLAAMRSRAIDWRPLPPDAPRVGLEELGDAPPPVHAVLRVEGEPVAGALGTVTATVRAEAGHSLYRARLRLKAQDPSSPWDGLVLPLGALAVDEQRTATASVALPRTLRARQDAIDVVIEAEGYPTSALAPMRVTTLGAPEPVVAATLRSSPSESGARVELTLNNTGALALTGIVVRFASPEDTRIELAERQLDLGTLAAGASAEGALGLRLAAGYSPDTLDLSLVVEAVELERALVLPVSVPTRGRLLHAAAPRLQSSAPLVGPAGPLSLELHAEDDQKVTSLTLWQGGDKIAWQQGDGRSLRLNQPLSLGPGSNRLTAQATDDQGATTRMSWVVLGEADGVGAVEAPEARTPEARTPEARTPEARMP